MFNATYFTYDGIFSGSYGLQIADFDDNAVKEGEALTLTLALQKASGALRFSHSGIECDTPPTCEFAVIRDSEFSAADRKEIMAWLVGRNDFKELTFTGGDSDGYTYRCVFTSVSTISVHGRCYGFRLTAQFDSPYARGIATSVTVGSGTHTISLVNNSGIMDDYVYPMVEFTGASVDIVNTTDDSSRHFTFSGMSGTTTVDNETRHIQNSAGSMPLSGFTSKKWLRLRRGTNVLKITSAGTVKITCPNYAIIGY